MERYDILFYGFVLFVVVGVVVAVVVNNKNTETYDVVVVDVFVQETESITHHTNGSVSSSFYNGSFMVVSGLPQGDMTIPNWNNYSSGDSFAITVVRVNPSAELINTIMMLWFAGIIMGGFHVVFAPFLKSGWGGR